MLPIYHFTLKTSKICLSGAPDLHGKIYLNICVCDMFKRCQTRWKIKHSALEKVWQRNNLSWIFFKFSVKRWFHDLKLISHKSNFLCALGLLSSSHERTWNNLTEWAPLTPNQMLNIFIRSFPKFLPLFRGKYVLFYFTFKLMITRKQTSQRYNP